MYIKRAYISTKLNHRHSHRMFIHRSQVVLSSDGMLGLVHVTSLNKTTDLLSPLLRSFMTALH